MGELLRQLGERYDLVVIDTAPTGVVSDAFPLLHKVDGMIVAARIGETTRDAAGRLREQLGRRRDQHQPRRRQAVVAASALGAYERLAQPLRLGRG